jgi:hypothetical protein
MHVARRETALASELTRLISTTPGVTRLYAPNPVVHVLAAAERIVPDVGVTGHSVPVRVDFASSSVTASIGVDTSATAGAIGTAVCTRLRDHLATAGLDLAVQITIAFVAA